MESKFVSMKGNVMKVELARTVVAIVVAVLLLVTSNCRAAEPSAALPDFGLMLNDDGDYSFIMGDPAASARALRSSVDALAGTPVRTLMYCVGAGSDVLYYPTKVASVWGWRKTKYDEPDAKGGWGPRTAKIKRGMEAGIDPIRIAGERARELGMRFFPSYRMNDNHFIFDPEEYPLTGEFWMKNRATMTIKESPITTVTQYGNLLDFRHDEVRNYRLAVIREVIDRYADISDGIELDFNRVQVFFPKGQAEQNAHLITNMLQQVRHMLNEVGEKQHKPLYLIVRIPPTLKNCQWAGLDIEEWMKQKLVDVIQPSQLMTLAHDMPIAEFVRIAKPAGCKVYPSLYPRTNYSWGFSKASAPSDFAGPAVREVSADLVRGAASNYWFEGADGFSLFNFHHEDNGLRPYSDRLYRIFRDLSSPSAITHADKVFAVTPAYYHDDDDTYEYRKQLPVTLKSNEPKELKLVVGDALADVSVADLPPYAGLRLGLRDLPANAQVKLSLNGKSIGPAGPAMDTASKKPDSATKLLQFAISDLTSLKQGDNIITIELQSEKAADTAKLVEVRLGVIYDREFLDHITK